MKYAINLLSRKEAPLAERLMYFSLNYLRYIIIITQLVVIGVFFYRFQIDQRIIDLKESVDQKKEIVQVVTPLLDEAEIISKRTTEGDAVIGRQSQFTKIIDYLMSQFPASANLTEIKIEGDSIEMTGLTLDLPQLQSFYYLLKDEKKFGNVNLKSIKKTDTGYDFILSLNKFKAS